MPHAQEAAHPAGYDYLTGSPHLKHARLRRRIELSLAAEVARLRESHGQCRVLEIGAGHGTLTRGLRRAGALVTVTEMSEPSAATLHEAFSGDAGVRVIHDPRGTWPSTAVETFELVAAISVLHHIPDYLQAVGTFADRTVPGGSFISWQDPIWYDRLARMTGVVARVAYLSWRLRQRNLRRGLSTQWRRWRSVYDESNVSDMAEYHVQRQGVDEVALRALLEARYGAVRLHSYWSTQSALWQSVGERLDLATMFALVGRYRRSSNS